MSSGQKALRYLHGRKQSCVEQCQKTLENIYIKGRVMGRLFILVCACFRENAVVTGNKMCLFCVSFLCCLNEVLFFWKLKFKKALIWKKWLSLTYFSHFLITRERTQKFLQHISHLHIFKNFARPIEFIFLANFAKITIGAIPGVDSYLCHFWSNQ